MHGALTVLNGDDRFVGQIDRVFYACAPIVEDDCGSLPLHVRIVLTESCLFEIPHRDTQGVIEFGIAIIYWPGPHHTHQFFRGTLIREMRSRHRKIASSRLGRLAESASGPRVARKDRGIDVDVTRRHSSARKQSHSSSGIEVKPR